MAAALGLTETEAPSPLAANVPLALDTFSHVGVVLSDVLRTMAANPDIGELAIAHERGWRAYHAIKAFIYSGTCRRRSLLDHFGDRAAGQPLERCCDVCDPQSWLPDPDTDERALAIPNRLVLKVADAGHWVHHDRLELFVEESKRFLLEP